MILRQWVVPPPVGLLRARRHRSRCSEPRRPTWPPPPPMSRLRIYAPCSLPWRRTGASSSLSSPTAFTTCAPSTTCPRPSRLLRRGRRCRFLRRSRTGSGCGNTRQNSPISLSNTFSRWNSMKCRDISSVCPQSTRLPSTPLKSSSTRCSLPTSGFKAVFAQCTSPAGQSRSIPPGKRCNGTAARLSACMTWLPCVSCYRPRAPIVSRARRCRLVRALASTLEPTRTLTPTVPTRQRNCPTTTPKSEPFAITFSERSTAAGLHCLAL
mmetsp:Transcript_8239/g.25652  ORF Transcript_8239/g.25652 Transcript_8239/m.25652 type:complete len:267 (-) Transcript_8239:471-1271(-)